MSSDRLSQEEAQARWICCPMCDRKACNRNANDCDVKQYLAKEAEEDAGDNNNSDNMRNIGDDLMDQ